MRQLFSTRRSGNRIFSLEHLTLGHDGAVKLEHLLLQDEVVAPLLDDVGLNRAARRTEVVEAGDTTIDVKRGPQKEPPRQDIFHSGAGERVVLLLLGGLLETRSEVFVRRDHPEKLREKSSPASPPGS